MVEDRPITRNLPEIYYFPFPSAVSTVRAVNRHTAREHTRPPEIVGLDDQIYVRKHPLFRTQIASLKAPLWDNPINDPVIIQKLKAVTNKLSFVLESRSASLEKAITDDRPHKRVLAHYLSRPILLSEFPKKPDTEVRFVDLNSVANERFFTALEDFRSVYTAARLAPTPTRSADSIDVIFERLNHIRRRFLLDRSAAVFVGYLGRTPVATGSVWPMLIDGVNCLQFADANVHPAYRRLGIGEAIVDFRVSYARHMKAPSLAFSYVFEEENLGQNFSMGNLKKSGFQPWFDVLYIDLPRAE